ncbi:hypothetical protein B4U80_09604 [Leptotrombidium deliense]|uniref:Uncharacterized protein n=1 Tax=Leptotrombidium deliense TaxID=299467 RepID=A0A443S4V4_9ACAR|nr:hypothetical protein B4U80_09604 [Leptotrombidium deliense]
MELSLLESLNFIVSLE